MSKSQLINPQTLIYHTILSLLPKRNATDRTLLRSKSPETQVPSPEQIGDHGQGRLPAQDSEESRSGPGQDHDSRWHAVALQHFTEAMLDADQPYHGPKVETITQVVFRIPAPIMVTELAETGPPGFLPRRGSLPNHAGRSPAFV
jgi:hypothetical protein